MNTREIALLGLINEEGLDNSQWGVWDGDGCPMSLAAMFSNVDTEPDQNSDRIVPDKHVYIWVDDVEAERIKLKLKGKADPDMEYCPEEGETVLIWDISEQ